VRGVWAASLAYACEQPPVLSCDLPRSLSVVCVAPKKAEGRVRWVPIAMGMGESSGRGRRAGIALILGAGQKFKVPAATVRLQSEAEGTAPP
jgi:hypothetical protein